MPWGIVYYQARDGSVPAEAFLDACPMKVEATILAVLESVRQAPPPQSAAAASGRPCTGPFAATTRSGPRVPPARSTGCSADSRTGRRESSPNAASMNRRSPSSRGCASPSARCSATASTGRTCGRSGTTIWPGTTIRFRSRSRPPCPRSRHLLSARGCGADLGGAPSRAAAPLGVLRCLRKRHYHEVRL